MYFRNVNGSPGFVTDDDHIQTDLKITDEEYKEYFKQEAQGKFFKVKENPTGTKLFDFLVESTPEPLKFDPMTDIRKLQIALAEVTEEMEKNKVESQLAIAEVAEAQSQTAPTSY